MNKHVFISYVRENQSAVDKLSYDLLSAGIEPWLDREEIAPGQFWKSSIQTAIQTGAYFIACFSREYVLRERTFMNEELLLAVEELRLRPFNRAWFIPVILSATAIPPLDIGAGKTLRDLQWVDLSGDWDKGFLRILRVMKPSLADAALSGARNELRNAFKQRYHVTETVEQSAHRLIINEAIQQFADAADDGYDSKSVQQLERLISRYIRDVTAVQLVRLVERDGRGLSLIGLEVFHNLYKKLSRHQRDELLALFTNRGDAIMSYYCKLRRKYPAYDLSRIVSLPKRSIEIDGLTIDRDKFNDVCEHWGPTRAFRRAVHRVRDNK